MKKQEVQGPNDLAKERKIEQSVIINRNTDIGALANTETIRNVSDVRLAPSNLISVYARETEQPATKASHNRD